MKRKQKQNKNTGKLKIGVIGLGRIGWGFHCAQIHGHRDFSLTAVSDPEVARLEEAKETYGCIGYTDYKSMFKEAGLDAVVIASPTHLHKPMAIEAFKQNIHVLLEKPMATTLREAQAIVRSATAHKRILTVYQPHRAAAYFQQLLKIIQAGTIGELYHVKFGRFRFVRRDDWQSLRKYGGGMLANYGAHVIDQILALIGPEIKKVYGNLRRVASLGDAEDVLKLVVETKSGCIGELDINQASTSSPYQMIVWGTRGSIMFKNNEFNITTVDPRALPKKKLNRSLASSDRRYPNDKVPLREKVVKIQAKLGVDFYKEFAKAIRTGCDPFIRPQETLQVMKVMEACRKSGGGIRHTPL